MALARALVNRPAGCLDEPPRRARLDARKQDPRAEAIQRDLGITFMYVTHDQGEAHHVR